MTRFDLQDIHDTPSARHQRWGRTGLRVVALIGVVSVVTGWSLHFAVPPHEEPVQEIAEWMAFGGLSPMVIGGVFSQFVLKPDATAVEVDRDGVRFIRSGGKEDRVRWDAKDLSFFLSHYPSAEVGTGTTASSADQWYAVASRTRTFVSREARDEIVSVATELGLNVTTRPGTRIPGSTTTHITRKTGS